MMKTRAPKVLHLFQGQRESTALPIFAVRSDLAAEQLGKLAAEVWTPGGLRLEFERTFTRVC
jgi:hypothetical protein